MKFRAVKKNGKIDIHWDRLDTYTANWKDGTLFDVEIVRRQKRKSDPMRKYYFSTVIPKFIEPLGYEPDEDLLFHKQLKIVYFRVKPDKKAIYRERDIPSVFGNESELPVSEKKKFVDWVVRKAAQEGIYIPDPNEGKAEMGRTWWNIISLNQISEST